MSSQKKLPEIFWKKRHDKRTDKQTNKQTDKQTDKLQKRHDKRTDKQTNRQTNNLTNRQTNYFGQLRVGIQATLASGKEQYCRQKLKNEWSVNLSKTIYNVIY